MSQEGRDLQKRGFLLVLSGPSGAGKNTVLNAVMQMCPDVRYSVSATTRPRRPQEQEGVDYFFLSEADFQRRAQANELLEWARVYGYCYGTPADYVYKCLEAGQVVIMDIDIQGARQIKKRMPDAVFVFLLPPTMADLEKRLRGRRSDSDEAISRRLASAVDELRAGVEYDYVILNDEVSRAAEKLKAIIMAERCRPRRSEYFDLLREIVGETGSDGEDDEATSDREIDGESR